MPQPPTVTMVIPTYGRAPALRDTIETILSIEGITEIIFVEDCSPDDTAAFLATVTDPRVRHIRHPVNRGVAAARNTGLDNASGEWVLFGEDDVRMPTDYLRVLLAVAEREGADIVSSPWLHLSGNEDLEASVAAARAAATDTVTLDDSGQFTRTSIRTPFLQARALVGPRVLVSGLRYDETYPENAYREETDFFVRAARGGFVCVHTPDTYQYQRGQWGGGARRHRLKYEYWVQRNNVKFMRRHGAWLHEQGLTGPPVTTALRFLGWRATYTVSGTVQRRLRDLKARRSA